MYLKNMMFHVKHCFMLPIQINLYIIIINSISGVICLSKIIAIANQKGGVGKTTTNVNLSACLARYGKKVLTVDIDPQGNTTSGLGIDKDNLKTSVYEVMINNENVMDAILETKIQNLHIIPSNIQLVGAEIEMTGMIAREHILKGILEPLRDLYDFILIDCPPSLGLLTLNALTAANKVLVPIQCEFYALEGLSQLINTVGIVSKRLNPGLSMEGVVLTMYDPRTNLSQQVVEEVKRYFNNKVYDTMIPRNVRLGEAPSFGLPIIMYDPSCSGARAYMQLAEEFIKANSEDRND